MCLHPEWGREGRRITRLKIVPTGENAAGRDGPRSTTSAPATTCAVHRSNTTLINATYKFFMWSGDEDFLRAMMPKLRKAMIFLNEHLQGRKDGC